MYIMGPLSNVNSIQQHIKASKFKCQSKGSKYEVYEVIFLPNRILIDVDNGCVPALVPGRDGNEQVPVSRRYKFRPLSKILLYLKVRVPFSSACEFGPYYSHLGIARTKSDLRRLFNLRAGFDADDEGSVRVVAVRQIDVAGLSTEGCPIAKQVRLLPSVI